MYNVVDNSTPTQIFNDDFLNCVSSIEIDGIMQDELASSYQLDNGLHTIKFEFPNTGYIEVTGKTFDNIDTIVEVTTPYKWPLFDIYAGMFDGCQNLKKVTIYTDCTYGYPRINSDDESQITDIIVKGSAKRIDLIENCFPSLTAITFENGVEDILDIPIGECTAVTIPNSVKKLYGPFYNCEQESLTPLENVKCNWDNLDYLGGGCFDNTVFSYRIPFDDNEIQYLGKFLYRFGNAVSYSTYNSPIINVKEGTYAICDYATSTRSWNGVISRDNTFVLPSTLKYIGYNAFNNLRPYNTSLDGYIITIPDGCETIQEGAFSSCKVKNVYIPGSVTTMGNSVFSESSVERAQFAIGFTSLPSSTFYNCTALKEIILPSTINHIGWSIFGNEQILDNLSIVCYATTPPTLEEDSLVGLSTSTTTIKVPSASIDAYKAASGWSALASCIEAIPNELLPEPTTNIITQ